VAAAVGCADWSPSARHFGALLLAVRFLPAQKARPPSPSSVLPAGEGRVCFGSMRANATHKFRIHMNRSHCTYSRTFDTTQTFLKLLSSFAFPPLTKFLVFFRHWLWMFFSLFSLLPLKNPCSFLSPLFVHIFEYLLIFYKI
jgi:hypothetical protein